MANEPKVHNHEQAPEQEAISPRLGVAAIVVVLITAGVLAGFGILGRMHNDHVLADTTTQLAAPTVIALAPKEGTSVTSFALPGNVTAFTDSPIYARTSGYLTKWYFDIGARVKKGQLLAEIASPEVDQQLAQANADLSTAKANANNAHVQAQRYQDLVGSNAVSQQDTDTFVNQASATASTVQSAEANLQRLHELQSFEKVYAPFDGIVTARDVDTGQLIDQGASKELFHMQALQTLRVYTNVPQAYTGMAKRGLKIDLTFPEHPGKTFQGTLERTADAIDPVTRTLLVEIDVNNRDGELMPGALAQVHFKAPSAQSTFIVPASALIFRREGMQLGTVVSGSNGPVAHLVQVTIGEDDGATVQIVTGLQAGDKIIQDPPDSLIEGEKVSPQQSAAPQGGK
ncbi:MAG TPA: efflux RND transporter periplasmic adaptor subunit [Terracidiphilus sp.]|jgi:RND family efflux transporter MFP subunit|nr:efflux RND transporter periplasmic adaptor subunit [Terracidiphilus sp.]